MASGLEINHKRDLHLLSWLFWVIVIAVVAVAGWLAYRWYTTGDLPDVVSAKALEADPNVDESNVTKKQIADYTVPKSHPRYVSIPSLGIGDTRVFPVGVDQNNVLESPNNINDAAWYQKTATPGQGYGAVLIDAHNGGRTKNGVFAKLGTLQPGDKVSVERGDGKTFTYSVVENQSMSLEEVNKTGMKKMLESADPNKEGLNLITCDGRYVPKLGQFDRRIMLRAVIDD